MTAIPAPAAATLDRSPNVWPRFCVIALVLLVSFLVQLPTDEVAEWKRAAFYDPGTALKANLLLDKHLIPTIDFGYTHGLLSLVYGRIGFALLGADQWSFFWLNLLPEMVMAFALARIAVATRIRGPAFILLLCALPIAILPCYLTLTHPLEAMLILLALADQIDNKLPRAVWLLTIALFIKPSMAYLYGLVVVLLLLKQAPNWRAAAFRLLPAAALFLMLLLALAAWVGIVPVIRTLLPITGARTYASTEFGFFTASGRRSWVLADPLLYLTTHIGIYLIAGTTAAAAAGGLLVQRMRLRRPLDAASLALATAGLLNLIFLIAFYGWPGAWTYYAYLPILGLVWCASDWARRSRAGLAAIILLIALVLLSHRSILLNSSDSWARKHRLPEMGNLWAWDDSIQRWKEVKQITAADTVAAGRTLVLVHGFVPALPPSFEMPDAWFPDLGIPTARELARIRNQIDHSQYIVLFHYKAFEDVWNFPEMQSAHDQFEEILNQNDPGGFRVLTRTRNR